ncbi:Hint domain-containing protein [Sulfitobacter sp. F26204]|uniref:Hint domain-containing protein n=1 Tax=Sulfitobacter sp. F26204 TaxID=2996014 RepID=UPI00225E6CDC|nr:Hint domain-containing protein [Sulfitobacter sp. F26204]MCX7561801.1 Hint domain-containing protein [Sulfitobacter sp. F26204]
MEELIVNGDFESPGYSGGFVNVNNYGAWFGNDIEVGDENFYFAGGSTTNSVVELDGFAGQSTTLQQDFFVSGDDRNGELSFDIGGRNTAAAMDNVYVQITNPSGQLIFSQTVAPATSGSFTTFTFPVSFGPEGTYSIAFIEQGTNNALGTVLDNVSLMVCYASGTKIATPQGDRHIEDLRVGDLVTVADGPAQPIKWIGSKKLSCRNLAAKPELRPILIRANALGPGVPLRDLLVSPQHRMLVRSKVSQRVLGDYETLIPAKKLTSLPGVEVMETADGVEYFHFALDQHAIVCAEGALSESLYLGPQALLALSPEARQELRSLFPELNIPHVRPKTARPFHSRTRDINELCMRLTKNQKPALELAA